MYVNEVIINSALIMIYNNNNNNYILKSARCNIKNKVTNHNRNVSLALKNREKKNIKSIKLEMMMFRMTPGGTKTGKAHCGK